MMIIIVLIAAIIVVAALYLFLFWDKNSITSVTETQLISTDGSSTPNTTLYFNHDGFTGRYAAGQQMAFTEPYRSNASSGTFRITKIVADTPGFSLNTTSPALPFILPNSPDGSNRALLTMTFDTPLDEYTGPFNYTVYMDYTP